jgi:hypothetical protein
MVLSTELLSVALVFPLFWRRAQKLLDEPEVQLEDPKTWEDDSD